LAKAAAHSRGLKAPDAAQASRVAKKYVFPGVAAAASSTIAARLSNDTQDTTRTNGMRAQAELAADAFVLNMVKKARLTLNA
jgi:hypothetical protein